MSDVKWIKLETDIFDNRKIRQIEAMPDGDTLVVIWLKLLTLAGVTNDKGWVYFTQDIPYTEELLATQFNRPINTVRLALKVFQQFQMIEVVDDVIHVSNWEKYQNVEGMEKVREQTRKRVARFREKQKQIECNDTVTLRNGTDIEEELDIDKKEKINKKENAPRFTRPSLEEVKAYCDERGNHIDPEQFINFYDSNGWKVGKNAMKDWKAAVRTWEKRYKEEHKDPVNWDEVEWK